MKAKEYKQLLDLEPDFDEALFTILDLFLKETELLIKKRNAQSNAAMISIFKEMDNKWKVLCKLDNRLKPGGYWVLIKGMMSEVYRYLKSLGVVKES